MRLRHTDYIELVIKAYNNKRTSNQLSPLLTQSTPGTIRLECANVYQERPEKKDEPTLRAFFGPAENERKLLSIIREFDVNKFKPLDNFLKSAGEKKTKFQNIELLAWLIDFKHRPYVYGMEAIPDEEELCVIRESVESAENTRAETTQDQNAFKKEEEGSDADNDDTGKNLPDDIEEAKPTHGPAAMIHKEDIAEKLTVPPINSYPAATVSEQKDSKKKNRWLPAGIPILAVMLSGGAYFAGAIKGEHCMYWADDHYEKISCDEKAKGRFFIPLDEERLQDFKKITRQDTITGWSIGKIYYLKTNNAVECFTTDGSHPVQVNRKLHVLTQYIFDKYLKKKDAAAKDSAETHKKPS